MTLALNPRKILVTGSTGFIGSALMETLRGRPTRRALRLPSNSPQEGDAVVGEFNAETNWESALRGIDCVVHLAARTHTRAKADAASLDAYRRINVLATRRLALQAAAAGVRRLVFMSSIKVNGEETPDYPFNEKSTPAPKDAYGVTKLEAEDVLRSICQQSRMELVIIRPPLVYGPCVKGNFLQLLQIISLGIPLPLALVRNRRSLIHVANLADAIVTCIDAPESPGNVWLVRDNEEISTPDLIRALAAGMGHSPRLFPFPVFLLRQGAALFGYRDAFARLTGTLSVDSSAIKRHLGWNPRIPLDQGLIETARWYHQTRIHRRN